MMFDYIKRKHIEQRMYHEAFENDASYDEKNPMAKWESGLWIRYKLFENVLASIPSADVVEPKHGEWIGYNADKGDGWLRSDGEPMFLVCNKCYGTVLNNTSAHWNFCPNCGADMRERKGE